MWPGGHATVGTKAPHTAQTRSTPSHLRPTELCPPLSCAAPSPLLAYMADIHKYPILSVVEASQVGRTPLRAGMRMYRTMVCRSGCGRHPHSEKGQRGPREWVGGRTPGTAGNVAPAPPSRLSDACKVTRTHPTQPNPTPAPDKRCTGPQVPGLRLDLRHGAGSGAHDRPRSVRSLGIGWCRCRLRSGVQGGGDGTGSHGGRQGGGRGSEERDCGCCREAAAGAVCVNLTYARGGAGSRCDRFIYVREGLAERGLSAT